MDLESFKLYKTTEEYKALSPKSKRRLRDKFRYLENRGEKLKYQKDYDQSIREEKGEKEKQIRAEKTKPKKRLKLRHRMKNELLKNPKHELGKRMFHVITTGEIDLNIHEKITDDDLQFLKTFILPDIPEPERKEEKQKYYQENRDKKLEQAKSYRDKKKEEENVKLINWNFRFYDPNEVISALLIQHNMIPGEEKYCQRERFKIKKFRSLSEDEKPAFLKKCREEHDAYLKAVEELPLEEKKQFLKDKKIL